MTFRKQHSLNVAANTVKNFVENRAFYGVKIERSIE